MYDGFVSLVSFGSFVGFVVIVIVIVIVVVIVIVGRFVGGCVVVWWGDTCGGGDRSSPTSTSISGLGRGAGSIRRGKRRRGGRGWSRVCFLLFMGW